MDKNYWKKIIWELMSTLRGAIYGKELSYSAVRMMFYKYAIDNYIGAQSREDMQCFNRAQKMFAMKDTETGVDVLKAVLTMIDREYKLDGILSSPSSIEDYTGELFGTDITRQKRSATIDNYKNILDFLGSIDLEEKEDNNNIGIAVVEALIEIIYENSRRDAYSFGATSSESMNRLASKLLEINSGDTFCDFVSGIGLSTIEITKEKMPYILNADINSGTAAISAMLYIMYGYKQFKVVCGNSISYTIPNFRANKVFVDFPPAMRVEKTPENEYIDIFFAGMNRLINDYLDASEDSTAIVTAPGGPLFKSNKQAIDFREKLIKAGLVKAVIVVPPLWGGTNIPTHLLLVTRKKNEKIIFINASETKTDSKEVSLSDDEICKIVSTINSEAVIDGYSNIVSYDEMAKSDFSFIPATYITRKRVVEDITVAEIDKQLKDLYNQLVPNNGQQ